MKEKCDGYFLHIIMVTTWDVSNNTKIPLYMGECANKSCDNLYTLKDNADGNTSE